MNAPTPRQRRVRNVIITSAIRQLATFSTKRSFDRRLGKWIRTHQEPGETLKAAVINNEVRRRRTVAALRELGILGKHQRAVINSLNYLSGVEKLLLQTSAGDRDRRRRLRFERNFFRILLIATLHQHYDRIYRLATSNKRNIT